MAEAAQVPERQCQICGGPVTSIRKVYCSDRCRYLAWKVRDANRKAELIKNLVLEILLKDKIEVLQTMKIICSRYKECPNPAGCEHAVPHEVKLKEFCHQRSMFCLVVEDSQICRILSLQEEKSFQKQKKEKKPIPKQEQLVLL